MEDSRGGVTVSGMLGKLLDSISGRKHATPKENVAAEDRARQLLHPAGLSVPVLNQARIRVVVFRDEKGVKQPIFDSQQISIDDGGEEQCSRSLCDMRYGERLESSLSSSSGAATSTTVSSHSAGWASQSGQTGRSRRGFLVKRPSTDSELLGEMMFGSMPMKVIGNTVKVHYIRSTDQLMLSKVFTSAPKPLGHCTLTDFSDSCPLSSLSVGSSSGRGSHRSFSADPRGLLSSHRRVSPDSLRPHSNSTLGVPISHSSSVQPSPSPLSSSPRSPSSPLNSYNPLSLSSSLTRRIQRSRTTSLENHTELYRKHLKPLDQPSTSSNGRRKRKYAIGFIICLSELGKPDIRHFQSFLFSHFTLIDAHLERLKIGVEEAYDGRKSSLAAADHLARAYETFLEDFMSLYKAPRIESPVWLSLVSCVGQRKQVCLQFMEELASAITEMDTKDTKYFLSSLLTAVLSHHLAWVFTVTRQQAADSNNRHGKHSSKSLGVLAESHPYNPLWAQLGDLLGAVGYPLKISRTVVSGQSLSAVSRLLHLLTYFIRCSEVEPGFTPDMIPTSPLLMQNAKIPNSTHTSADDLINQLEENDVFGSRASSVTVMSDPDRASLFSPFASPVNQGMDTPIVRTYPFGIRSTPLSVAGTTPGSDVRKGSQSDSDSLDSLHMQHSQLHAHGMGLDPSYAGTGMGAMKKMSSLNRSGDLSMSQSSQSSLKKQSPLLFSSDSTTRLDSNCFGSGSCELPPLSATNVAPCDFIGEMSGNSCCTATRQRQNYLCHDSSKCPVGREDFITFDPTSKHLLSPDHTHCSLPSHTSSSSLDSGYDQSLSLTDSCRDSCTEFTSSSYYGGGGPCSFKSGTYAHYKMSSSCRTDGTSYSSNAGNVACTELDLDSGLGGKRPLFLAKAQQHQLEDDSQGHLNLEEKGLVGYGKDEGNCGGGLAIPTDRFGREGLTLSPQTSASSLSLAMYQARNSEEMSIATVHSNDTSIASQDEYPLSDPECSLKGVKRRVLSFDKGSLRSDRSTSAKSANVTSQERNDEEEVSSPSLPSPLSPDPTNSQLDLDADVSAPVESLALSSDPTRALPPRKLRNHFRRLSDNCDGGSFTSEEAGLSSASEISINVAQCSQVMRMQSPSTSGIHNPQLSAGSNTTHGVSSFSPAVSETASLTQSARHISARAQSPHWTHTQESHSGIPLSTQNISVPISPLSHTSTSTSSLSSSPVMSPSHTKSQQRSSLTGQESPYGSESDSGRGTKISLHVVDLESNTYSQPVDFDSHSLSLLSESLNDSNSESLQVMASLRPGTRLNQSKVRASSSPPLIGLFRSENEEEMCSLGRGECPSFPIPSSNSTSNLLAGHCYDNGDSDRNWANTFLSLPTKKSSDSRQTDQSDEKKENEDPTKSLSTRSLKKCRHNPSLLHQQLYDHDRSLHMGYRPPALERFGNFEDVPLPDLEEFHLDTPTDYHPHGQEEAESHRQLMSDFGHSLFVGVSPKYLSDFVLHGTTQPLDQGFQDKLVQDLAHAIKYPVIDEPVDVGVGIVASTDTWSVKLHAVTKSLQTNDVLVGSVTTQPSRAIRQMLASVKNMHALNMPPDFCLSYLEDCLMSLNDQSVLLANALLEKGGLEVELSELLPGIMETLSLNPLDLPILLPLAAINSVEPDMSARLNHLHMQKLLGKHFI